MDKDRQYKAEASSSQIEVIPDEPISTRDRSRFARLGPVLDKVFPPHWSYFGFRRKTFLLIATGIFIMLLALILGLAIGLSGTHGGHANLPLPGNAEIHTGDLTYYEPGLGSCGITSNKNEAIVAISHILYDAAQTGSNPNANPLCGKKIRASRRNERTGSQESVDLTVVDRCTGCQPNDLDVTTSVFDRLANHDAGRVKVNWAWLS